ncbi:MAG: 30S ribosome-binding factor RbfA [Panacagrimonas sp.]
MREFPRKLRLNTQMQRELADLIDYELTDPRVAGVSITNVDVAPDLRNATILVSSLDSDDELLDAVKALNGAAGRLRKGVGSRLKLRQVPQLHFRADMQLREATRITQLIHTAVDEDARVARDRDEG